MWLNINKLNLKQSHPYLETFSLFCLAEEYWAALFFVSLPLHLSNATPRHLQIQQWSSYKYWRMLTYGWRFILSTTAGSLSEEVYHVKGGYGKITEHSINVEKYNNWKEQRKHESSGSKKEKKNWPVCVKISLHTTLCTWC